MRIDESEWKFSFFSQFFFSTGMGFYSMTEGRSFSSIMKEHVSHFIDANIRLISKLYLAVLLIEVSRDFFFFIKKCNRLVIVH